MTLVTHTSIRTDTKGGRLELKEKQGDGVRYQVFKTTENEEGRECLKMLMSFISFENAQRFLRIKLHMSRMPIRA